MRCVACNVILTDGEATDKYENGEFIDLCLNCQCNMEEDEEYPEDNYEENL